MTQTTPSDFPSAEAASASQQIRIQAGLLQRVRREAHADRGDLAYTRAALASDVRKPEIIWDYGIFPG